MMAMAIMIFLLVKILLIMWLRRLSYYENTGTATSPEFVLKKMIFWASRNYIYYNLKIQFADINRDTKIDLVFTGYQLSNRINTALFYP